MDYESYRAAYFADPQPEPRFDYHGLQGATLYFQDYEAAVAYYTRALGPLTYVEGQETRGWRVGETWLTLLKGQNGNPSNIEINFVMATPAEAERLQKAFIEAGGTGEPPSDQLMYAPVRYCPVRDLFGTDILVLSWLENE